MKQVLLSVLLLISVVVHGEDRIFGESEGLLVTKGKEGEYIEFIPDGAEKAVKYIPEWVGGNPKDGGGLKKETVEKIKKLITPNRVLLKWKSEEHLRVLDIKILEPEKKEGNLSGTVSALGENWVDVKSKVGEQIRIERFFPRWLGNAPKEGGGLDKEILKEIGKLKVGDAINVGWVYDERKRVTRISRLVQD